jgi:rRNA-processing protein FCF1
LQDVVFDSSFLLAIVENPTPWHDDIVAEIGSFRAIILDCTYEELLRIARGNSLKAKYARLAREIAKEFLRAKCYSASPDDELISYANRTRSRIATIDRDMVDRVRGLGISYVTLRRKRVFVS